MANWLQSSFDACTNSQNNAKVGRSAPSNTHQLQRPAISAVSTNNDYTNVKERYPNGETVSMPAQNKPQHCQYQSNAEINRIKSGIFSKTLFQTPENWEKEQTCNLGSLKGGKDFVSAFAVVKDFVPPKMSSGTDMFSKFGLVDPTLYKNNRCLRCICFQQFEADMPLITNIGDIIKFPLRIASHKGGLQGRTFDDRFPWMTFDGQPGEPIVPRYSRSSPPVFTDADKKKVEELRSWAESIQLVVKKAKAITLADLTADLYFDFSCQVVHVDHEKNELYVWDGTAPSFESSSFSGGLSGSSLEMFESATEYGERVVGKCVKVAVFGCNLRFTCKVGQYILIPSLHFILKDGGGATRTPVYTLHSRIKRKIKVLNESDRAVMVLKERMEMLPTPEPSISDLVLFKVTQELKRKRIENLATTASKTTMSPANVSSCGNTNEKATTRPDGVSQKTHTKQVTTHTESCSTTSKQAFLEVTQAPKRKRISENLATTANETRMSTANVSSCGNTNENAAIRPDGVSKQMITHTESCSTASRQAIVNPSTNSSIPKTNYTIREIKNERFATRFRCQARIRFVLPNEPVQFVKYVCKSCRQRYVLDDYNYKGADALDFSAIVNCLNLKCNASVSPTVQFSLILKDDTGLLDLSVTGKVAEKFLPRAEPLMLLTDIEAQKDVKHLFETLLSKKECMEFDIERFNLPNGRTIHSLADWECTSGKKD